MVNKIQTSSTENYKVRLIIIEFAVRQLQRRVGAGKLYIGNSPCCGLCRYQYNGFGSVPVLFGRRLQKTTLIILSETCVTFWILLWSLLSIC